MKRLGFDLIILGAPAAGKDTQADLLRKKYQLFPIESGKHWRSAAKRNDRTGQLLRRTFSRGELVPVSLMKKFIKNKLANLKKNQDLIFIGNPRIKAEAELVNRILSTKDREYLVIFLTLPEPEIAKRSKRRKRDIQDRKYVSTRIQSYKAEVLNKTFIYFKKLGRLKVVNGNQPIPRVFKNIEKHLNDYQKFRRH